MPPKCKPKDPGVGLRRSSRERKKVNFGSDFELEDDPQQPPSKRAKQSEPTPGTSKENPDDPPLPRLDPDPAPDPIPDPKKVTWPSEPEYWAKPQLPTNHSK